MHFLIHFCRHDYFFGRPINLKSKINLLFWYRYSWSPTGLLNLQA